MYSISDKMQAFEYLYFQLLAFTSFDVYRDGSTLGQRRALAPQIHLFPPDSKAT